MVVEHFEDLRKKIPGRRAYDGTVGIRHFEWPKFGRRKFDNGS
jgi:hypothetical protein